MTDSFPIRSNNETNPATQRDSGLEPESNPVLTQHRSLHSAFPITAFVEKKGLTMHPPSVRPEPVEALAFMVRRAYPELAEGPVLSIPKDSPRVEPL